MLSKICTKCNIDKPLDQFSKNARNKTNGKQPKCKQCFRDYCIENSEKLKLQKQIYSKVNSEQAVARSSEWSKNNRERSRAIKTKWRINNSKKMNDIRTEWSKNNPEYLAFNCRKYQASKKNAIPKWADMKKIRYIYKESRRLSLETGIQHHVDHIVPITSDIVCGLHCEANLQILTFNENVKKGNHYWEDMP
jgi:hypothetical protein